MNIGRTIRARREELHLRQKDVARGAGVSPGYLSQLEADQLMPSEALLRRVAKVLGLEGDLLVVMSGRVPARILEIMEGHAEEGVAVLRRFEREHGRGGQP